MISRRAEVRIRKLAGQFPAVLILGPRQCGKTTLARRFLSGDYFDLEKPSDAQVFAADPEYALRNLKGPVILDEAQTLPQLFPVLRALIDESRRRYGRFFLLGSVSPELLRDISESLAGRVGIVELTPFLIGEVAPARKTAKNNGRGNGLNGLWLRGGFPDAFHLRAPDRWQEWQENYLRTFVERDVARRGPALPPLEMRRLMSMIASVHGGLLNASELGRSMAVSYHTIQRILDLLEGYFLARRLTPYDANLGKRLVKAPKLYVRDSGLLHYLLGIATPEQLLQSPARGVSFEGFLIEQIIALEQLARPSSRFHFFRTHTGIEIDLIVDRGQNRIGLEFKCGVATGPRDWAHLKTAIDDGVIDRGAVVYLGDRRFPVSESLWAVPAADLLSGDEMAIP